ncbi:MAG: ribonuclease P protein component [Rhodospirillales bacterium]|uniref:Ribonuclease P protein component n=2 Tax=Thalassospira xiamenensis TaxID=220697 RepID=A0ABR5Y5F4_9PROT|nr:ribonuclease P protein component [Thalassospira xiamenensis M-5 = DSM 17429]KZD04896.1 ribonuclease P protein component [Thalassospira xiamenensis]MBL4840155.1 ribonuclease P protein component [Thalassospira sp.]MBR9780443.1 ribonuclease P protein component [Rhodospirillales bacterium]PXX32525.1 ribonuclease P protein component [Thalassospira sp. 11-3]QPL36243.1 ribonuclease P protein component [Thalassospira sp. B30-1]
MTVSVERLKKRAEFLRVAGTRRKWVTQGLILQGAPRPGIKPDTEYAGEDRLARVGFTVTKKVGKAVVRNRVRRRLRAVADQLMADMALPGWDYVVIGRQQTIDRDFEKLVDDMRFALRRIPDAKPSAPDSQRPRKGRGSRPGGATKAGDSAK